MKRRINLAVFAIFANSISASLAEIDLNGDHLSDLWQLRYAAQGLAETDDPDGDGANTIQEEAAGTDPFDSNSRHHIQALSITESEIIITWTAQAQKYYRIDSSPDLVTWTPGPIVYSGGGQETANIPRNENDHFCRILVYDGDQDGDGLTDYEEGLLGFDANSPNSTGSVTGGDFPAAVALLSADNPFTLAGQEVTGSSPSAEAASRFLMMATLGASREEIASLEAMGYAAWIDDQFTKTSGHLLPELQDRQNNGLPNYANHKRHAWWRQVMTSDDLLRQRIAFALSQIWVISDRQLDAIPLGMAHYYDQLLDDSFGNFRTALFNVAMHPAMGGYLSHLRNRKPDPAQNRFSDENFAREIKQLFSIGLFELNPDGTRIQDPEGNDIPTYTNETITNFARAFTGLTYGVNGSPTHDDFFHGSRDFQRPMEIYEGEHDTDTKTLLNGTVLPAFADAPGRSGIDDINDAIDNIFAHQNVGPFFGRLLIQRLVTSNPSPAYLSRVSAAFADNGLGVRGDFRAVIKAILLDPEAITPNATSGRLREPFVRYTRLLRTFDASSANDNFQNSEWNTANDLAQLWFASPSVFNFFTPNHQPGGDIAEAGLFAPEFQILNAVTAITAQNFYNRVIQQGAIEYVSGPDQIYLDLSDEILLANDPPLLLDRLDLLLTAGSLSESTHTAIIDAITQIPPANALSRVRTAVRLIVLSPDFSIFQ